MHEAVIGWTDIIISGRVRSEVDSALLSSRVFRCIRRGVFRSTALLTGGACVNAVPDGTF